MGKREIPLREGLIRYLQRTRPDVAARLEDGLAAFVSRPARQSFFRLFALAPRWTGKRDAAHSVEDKSSLAAVDPGLARAGWRIDQLARLLILSTAQNVWPAEQFARELEILFNTADTGELVALYRSLPLLDEPRQFTDRVREGARSNMIPVFLAVAHHNSFPSQYFDESGWNQLVLKAMFNACSLEGIVGLEARNNPRLTHMLADYVRERWAARRDVPWDIWRCIGPYAHETGDTDLMARALEAEAETTRLAAALALREVTGAEDSTCGSDDTDNTREVRELSTRHKELDKAVEKLNWHDLAALAEGD